MPEKYVKITLSDDDTQLDCLWLQELLRMTLDSGIQISELTPKDVAMISRKDVEYCDWHLTLGKQFYAMDVDLVEWIDKEVETRRFASRTHALEFATSRLKNEIEKGQV